MTDDDRSLHDLKNQLAIIHGFSELLLAEVEADDPHRRDLEEIHEQAVAALDLLGRMYPARANTAQ